MKTTNNIPVPDKDFYDIGVVVDNYKLNIFTKALGKEGKGYILEIHPFINNTTTLKVMQVPKADLGALSELIKQLNGLSIRVHNKN